MHYSFLCYDIPSASDLPNPSPELRRVGVRINLSTWVVPEDRIPWNLLHELSAGSASWHVVRFDEAESRTLLALATATLTKEVARARQACARSLGRLESACDSQATEDALATDRKYRNRSRAILKRAERLLNDARHAAEVFGVAEDTLPIESAWERVQALRLSAQTRASVYAGMAATVRGTMMETAARESDVPPLVLADFIEETQGADCSAARAAF